MIEVEQPLPFNIYTEDGTLLMRKGVVIFNQSQVDAIYERECFTTPNGTAPEPPVEAVELTVSEYVEDLINRLDIAYNNFVTNGYNLINDIMRIAVEIVRHLDEEPDTFIGVVHIRSDLKYSVIRTLQNTVFSVLTAQSLKWDKKRVVKMACASLTANLGMYPLQDDLAKKDGPLEEWQRKMVRKHPAQSIKMLVSMGVKDKEWLYAVGHHHERMDGSGYPNGLVGEKIKEEARIFAIVDRYGSAISPRGSRKASNPQDIMRIILGGEKHLYDQTLVRHFIAEIGVYPPGVTVLLRNGDVGVVTQRRLKRTRPIVSAVWDSYNQPYAWPVERDTVFPQFAVVEHITHDDAPRLNADIFWGNEKTRGDRSLPLFRKVDGHKKAPSEGSEEDITLF